MAKQGKFTDKTAETDATAEVVKKARKAHVRGQKYKTSRAKVDKARLYSIEDAVKLVRETDIAKFVSTVEMHMSVKKEGLSVSLTLPHSAGSTKKVVVADDQVVLQLEAGKVEFDVLLATAEMMPKLVKFAKILGPRGMMPNPKNGTLLKDIKDASKFSLDKMLIKTEKKAPVIHTTIGKLSMSDADLIENAQAVIKAVGDRQILKCYITSSMSPSVKVAIN